jgi:peroxiredoxin-like protein
MQTKDEKKLFFTANVVWTEGRSGELESRGLPAVRVSAPPEFQGRENTWTPEHLYAGSVASCFMLTFLALAERSNLDLASLSVTAESKLEQVEGATHQITEIVLKPSVVVRRIDDVRRVEQLLKKAERGCFIAASIKSRVVVVPQVYHRQNPVYPCPAVSEPKAKLGHNHL